jgi:hypothetical protein
LALPNEANNLSRKELATIGVIAAAVLLASWVWPWSRTWLLVLLAGGVPVLILAVLPIWALWSVWRGLRVRSRARWRIEATDDAFTIWNGSKPLTLRIADIGRARLARSSNWTQSRLVEDALTLVDRRGARLLKVPASAQGFTTLLEALAASAVPMSRVDVSAPAILD